MFIYYITGLAAAGIAYLVVGHEYMHAPGLYHWIIVLTFLGGVIWTLATGIKCLLNQRTPYLGGIIVSNALIVFGFVVFIYSIFRANDEFEAREGEKEEMVLSSSGDTVTLRHDGDIVYMRVGDSVLIDYMDSTLEGSILDSTANRSGN